MFKLQGIAQTFTRTPDISHLNMGNFSTWNLWTRNSQFSGHNARDCAVDRLSCPLQDVATSIASITTGCSSFPSVS